MKASMEAFVVVGFMEAFVEAFVDAGVEVTFVEAFKASISFMEAFVNALVGASVDADFVKASIPSGKAYITSGKGFMGAFVEVTSMELSWKLLWKLQWRLVPRKFIYLSNLPWKLSWIVEASLHVASGKASKTSRKASNTSMKASTGFLGVVTSMEAFMQALLDACGEVIFVEAFKSSISSMEGFMYFLVEVSVDVDSVKDILTSAKASISSSRHITTERTPVAVYAIPSVLSRQTTHYSTHPPASG